MSESPVGSNAPELDAARPAPPGGTAPGSTASGSGSAESPENESSASTGEAYVDEVLEPEEDPGLPHSRTDHGGMPLHPDDDALNLAVEHDRVAAGVADFAPDDVPPATDPLPPGTDERVNLAERGLLGDTSVD